MLTENDYAEYLATKGRNLSEVRKHDADLVMNASFDGDLSYKRVYILDSVEGWHWTDAKYHQHSRQSILSDSVDYYLQFRPKEHHKIGSYVFIPDEESDEVGFADDNPENPFKDENFQDIFKAGKLWLIVYRNQSKSFVRYMILQCDWNLQWIAEYQGQRKIFHCYGITRTQNSYTSWKFVKTNYTARYIWKHI